MAVWFLLRKCRSAANGARMTRLQLRKRRCSPTATEIGKWVKSATLLRSKRVITAAPRNASPSLTLRASSAKSLVPLLTNPRAPPEKYATRLKPNSVAVPGAVGDGSLHLVGRATSVQHTSSSGQQITSQQVEQAP